MPRVVLLYALYADGAAAEAAARMAVTERLAACANLLAPCTSFYRWEGAMRREGEVPVIFKTSPDRRAALLARLRAAHGYAVPAISAWEAETNADYAAWVAAETREPPAP